MQAFHFFVIAMLSLLGIGALFAWVARKETQRMKAERQSRKLRLARERTGQRRNRKSPEIRSEAS